MSDSREPQTLEEWREAYFVVLKDRNDLIKSNTELHATILNLKAELKNCRERLAEYPTSGKTLSDL